MEYTDSNQLEVKDFQLKEESELQVVKYFYVIIKGPSIPGLDTSLGFLTRNVEDL